MNRHVFIAHGALALMLAACGARPAAPDFEQMRAAATPAVPPAEAGWWHYLVGDATAAAEAFARAPDSPLAALGRVRLAADNLDAETELDAASKAASGDGWTVVLALEAARRAADVLPDGAVRLDRALGVAAATRRVIGSARHTVRISFLPYLDLRRSRQAPPELDSKTSNIARALGKRWRLSPSANPDRDGLVLSTWPLDPGPAHLELDVGGPLVAWRDGRVVCATPPGRFPPGVVRFTAPGDGPLLVVWAASHAPRLWQWPRPAPGPAWADVWDAEASEKPSAVVVGRRWWIRRYLRTEVALADADFETVDALLLDAPQTAAFAHQRARAVVDAPDLPSGAVRDRARASWEAVESLAPVRSHLERGRIAEQAGEFDVARRHLSTVAELAPGAYEAHRALHRIYLSLGWYEEAQAALAAAERVAPSSCALLDEQSGLVGSRGDVGARAHLVEQYAACQRPLDAIELLLDLHRPADALTRIEPMWASHKRGAPAARWVRAYARALVGLGRLDEAAARFGALDEAGGALARLDLEAATHAHDSARHQSRLAAFVAAHPTAREALEIVVAHPEWSPFADLAIDTEAAIAAFEAEPALPGPAVRVLDHSATLYFPDGKSLRWAHEVLAIRSRDAAEEYGEIGVPEDAHVVSLYTRKFDGRRLYAEEVPEKSTITLPDLDSGDFVIARYLEVGDNGYLYNRGFLTPRVYFQGVDLPIFRQRFDVFGPDGNAIEYQRLAGAPRGLESTLGSRRGMRFETHQVDLRNNETNAAPAGLWLPSVRAGRDIEFDDDLDYYRDRVAYRRRRSPAFDRWVQAQVADRDRGEQIEALSRAVRAQLLDEVGLVADDAARMVEEGRGSRALVLSAALEAAGIEHSLLLARPRVSVPAGPFLQVADFPYPMLCVRGLDGSDRWIDPGPDRAPIGFVPFPMLGGDAVVLWPPSAPTRPVKLPQTREIEDSREVRLVAHWGLDGKLRGEVTDRLTGQEAITIGAAMQRLDPARWPEVGERLLLGAIGVATVTRFDDPLTAESADGALTLRYEFEAEVGDALQLGVFPMGPGRWLADLSVRRTPLTIDIPIDQTVHVELTSDRPLRIDDGSAELNSGEHHFALSAELDGDELIVDSRLVVAGGRIDPVAYEAFATWARRVDDAERLSVTAAASAVAARD